MSLNRVLDARHARAGGHPEANSVRCEVGWFPACAGMTEYDMSLLDSVMLDCVTFLKRDTLTTHSSDKDFVQCWSRPVDDLAVEL